ncbi:expressed unknown protein [Seminavis robusta]|uniref:CRAL-TRIO domain-containing protein n=1 Tax=Seminavis robusta TaxID=568900 RepID=A0A9N8E378_9STRA|nr:expressed unknown protein [Seminavis robusta]|eukprot:Sro509_g157070.1 n/a (309) ;mRNA; r:38236-39162
MNAAEQDDTEGGERFQNRGHQDDNNDDGAGRRDEEAPSRPLGPHDPRRMKLTHEEQTWALRIKTAVEETPDLDYLSDFWYGALALIEEDDIEGALCRAQELQDIRKEYKIVNTYAAARRTFYESIKLIPGEFLTFSYNREEGYYVLAFDMAKQPTAKTFQSQNDGMNIKLRQIYYLCQVCAPDFEAIRKGVVVLVECQNVDMTVGTGNMAMMRKSWHIMLNYPFRVQKLKHFHTGVFANLLVSGVKRFLPEDVRNRFEVGCISEGGTLDKMFLQPNLEVANERFLGRIEATLERRFLNEATFQLTGAS